MLKVSIVVPIYNSEKYLSECLDSLLAQTYEDIEVICVNDGSTDSSLEILEQYVKKDSRIKIFSKKNEGKGAASARNLGLLNATGDYVQFLDSDDFFELDMVDNLVSKILDTNSDVVIYKANRYDNKIKKITQPYVSIELDKAPHKEYFNWKECPDKIFQVGDLIAWNKIYRKDLLIDNNLWFEPIAISDDQYIPALSLILAKRISFIDKAFVNYRFNTGNSQVDSQPKHPEAAYLATYSIVSKMKELGVYETLKRSYLNMAMRLMREYFDKMTEYETIKFLYDTYKGEVFKKLEAERLRREYFYDLRIGEWYEMIMHNSLEEILFRAARGFGNDMTTAVIRFQFPYEKVKRNSKIVLVGKGLVGKYWYAQLIISGYAEVVYWAESKEAVPCEYSYEQMVIAK